MNFGTNGGRDQEDEQMNIAKSSNFSSTSSSPQYKTFFPVSNAGDSNTEEAPNFTQTHHYHHQEQHGEEAESSVSSALKEHMFDKVVTPSDVGKLNRLVIPKQYAEKYFPLDASNNENNKGLLLNFEDAHGKPWRFRYSYWNSSQSYVMTKGWSRFVKDKKLDAGDIVSFFRGIGELCKDHLYIDWRRRVVNYNGPSAIRRDFPQNYTWNSRDFVENRILHHHNSGGGAGTGGWSSLFLHPPPQSVMQLPQQRYNNNNNHVSFYPNYEYDVRNSYHQYNNGAGVCSPRSIIYLRSTPGTHAHYDEDGGSGRSEQMTILDSVPVVHQGKAEGKKMRLFGVNMECGAESSCELESNDDDATKATNSQSRLYNGIPVQIDFLNKGKPSSPMSLDLDI